MSSTIPLLLRLVSSSVGVASKSGTVIKSILKKGNLNTIDKGVNDFQTEADRSVQRLIVSSLNKKFPKVTIIGEENLDPVESEEEFICEDYDENVLFLKCPEEYIDTKDEEIVVWVDPLDGTKEYTQGILYQVTVLIGIAINGKAVSGVIHQPYHKYQTEKDIDEPGRTIWGIVGMGAYGIVKQDPPLEHTIATTRSRRNKAVEDTLKALHPTHELKVGGAGYKVLLVIEGKAHAYIYPCNGCKKWDTCAPEAILSSLGGKMTDVFGNPIQYHKSVPFSNSTGILAVSNPDMINHYVNSIPAKVKAGLKCLY